MWSNIYSERHSQQIIYYFEEQNKICFLEALSLSLTIPFLRRFPFQQPLNCRIH